MQDIGNYHQYEKQRSDGPIGDQQSGSLVLDGQECESEDRHQHYRYHQVQNAIQIPRILAAKIDFTLTGEKRGILYSLPALSRYCRNVVKKSLTTALIPRLKVRFA